jgi:hypothetical protein
MYKCHSDIIRPIGTVVLHLATRWLPCPKPYIETNIITLFMQKDHKQCHATDSLPSLVSRVAGLVMKAVIWLILDSAIPADRRHISC